MNYEIYQKPELAAFYEGCKATPLKPEMALFGEGYKGGSTITDMIVDSTPNLGPEWSTVPSIEGLSEEDQQLLSDLIGSISLISTVVIDQEAPSTLPQRALIQMLLDEPDRDLSPYDSVIQYIVPAELTKYKASKFIGWLKKRPKKLLHREPLSVESDLEALVLVRSKMDGKLRLYTIDAPQILLKGDKFSASAYLNEQIEDESAIERVLGWLG